MGEEKEGAPRSSGVEEGAPRLSRNPLLAATLTALVSTGLLALAVWHGWLGPDVGRGDEFCEAARGGRVRQPANAVSNAGFVVAGLLIALRARRPDRLGDVLPRHRGLAGAMACVVVCWARRARRCTPPSPRRAGCST